MKQIYKLNSSQSWPNSDSQDKKEYLFNYFYFKDIWTYFNIYESCGETNSQIEFLQNRASIQILLMEKGIKELPTMEILQFFLIPFYAYNKISISLCARISLLKSLLNQMWLLAQHGWQFLDCDALPNVDCTWCEWISGCEERRVILIKELPDLNLEMTELNYIGYRTGIINQS